MGELCLSGFAAEVTGFESPSYILELLGKYIGTCVLVFECHVSV